MELKEKPGTIVGDFSFKGISPDGMIEIGYGLKKGYCKNGYMTEAVKAVSAWALEQDEVTRVEACSRRKKLLQVSRSKSLPLPAKEDTLRLEHDARTL